MLETGSFYRDAKAQQLNFKFKNPVFQDLFEFRLMLDFLASRRNLREFAILW